MKALVGAFNQEKALVGAFSVIVQLVVEPMDQFAALVWLFGTWSVMVMGARSTIFLSLSGGGPLPTTGTCCVNTHKELPGRDSSRARAFSKASNRSRLSTNPTRY